MSKISVYESSDTGRVVTDYGKLSARELKKRISAYEKKYGIPYARFSRQFDCDSALPWETSDAMDWENLIEERKVRTRESRNGEKKKCLTKEANVVW